MHTVSADYAEIVSGTHHFEVKIAVGEGGDAFELDRSAIYSVTVDGGLFASDTLSFGGCFSRMIEAKLRVQSSSIPRMAALRPYVRAVNGSIQSEWIPKGVFYTDTRSYDRLSGTLVLTGYDAMLKAETEYIDGSSIGLWPQSMRTVASDIASILGLTFDSRSYPVSDSYQVQLPAGYTMREVLGYIAAAHAGNWVITDEGKLRLISAASAVDTEDLSFGVKSYTTDDAFEAISRYRIFLEDDTVCESGDDSGRTVEVVCPWGNTAMAASALSLCSGFAYQPFQADGAVLPPIVEIGDKVVVNGVTHVLVSASQSLDSLCSASISAPAENEVDHEYPYTPSGERELKRVEGQVATLKIAVDSIDLTGYVTFTDLTDAQSHTFINGANIITGTISADDLRINKVWNYDKTLVAIDTGNSDSTLYIGGAPGQSGWDYSNLNIYSALDVTIGNHLNSNPLHIAPNGSYIYPNTSGSWSLGTQAYAFSSAYSSMFHATSGNTRYGIFGYDSNTLYCTPLFSGYYGLASYLGMSAYYWDYAYIGKQASYIGNNAGSLLSFFGSAGSAKGTVSNNVNPLRPLGEYNPAIDLNTVCCTVNWLTYVLKNYGLIFESYVI